MADNWQHEMVGLPSVVRFLGEVRDEVAAQRSTIVLVPTTVPLADGADELMDLLDTRGLSVAEVVAEDDRQPLQTIDHVLHLSWQDGAAGHSVEALLDTDGLPDVVLIHGLDRLSDCTRRAWVSLIQLWSRASKSLADRGRPTTALCAFVSAALILDMLPDPDVYLSLRWWWRIPSILELRLLCRTRARTERLDPTDLWREHIIASLSGNDLDLLGQLWLEDAPDPPRLLEAIARCGESRGWTPEKLHEWNAPELVRRGKAMATDSHAAPPVRCRALWAHGALHWTPEYGVELHPAALVALGCDVELRHRLWRGQAALLLPTVDGVRAAICQRLTATLGPDWPFRWAEPRDSRASDAVKENPLACELGHMRYVLSNFVGRDEARKWRALVNAALDVRNDLAHHSPVSLTRFHALHREMRRAGVA